MQSPRSSTASAPTITNHSLDIEKNSSPQSLTLCNNEPSTIIDDRKSRCGTIVSRLKQFKKSVM
jgi:hypothetical protein